MVSKFQFYFDKTSKRCYTTKETDLFGSSSQTNAGIFNIVDVVVLAQEDVTNDENTARSVQARESGDALGDWSLRHFKDIVLTSKVEVLSSKLEWDGGQLRDLRTR